MIANKELAQQIQNPIFRKKKSNERGIKDGWQGFSF